MHMSSIRHRTKINFELVTLHVAYPRYQQGYLEYKTENEIYETQNKQIYISICHQFQMKRFGDRGTMFTSKEATLKLMGKKCIVTSSLMSCSKILYIRYDLELNPRIYSNSTKPNVTHTN